MPSQPLPDVPNALSLKFAGTVGGQPFMHLLHATHDASTPNSTDCLAVAVALSSWWLTNISPLQSNVTIMNNVVVTDISSRTGALASTATARTGVASGAVSNQISYAVGWAIARRYRGGHPRTYHAGMFATQLNGTTQVSAAARTSLLAGWNSIITALSTASQPTLPNLRLCQVSYYHGKNTDGTPMLRPTPLIDYISGSKGDLRLDSQRHRLGRPL